MSPTVAGFEVTLMMDIGVGVGIPGFQVSRGGASSGGRATVLESITTPALKLIKRTKPKLKATIIAPDMRANRVLKVRRWLIQR